MSGAAPSTNALNRLTVVEDLAAVGADEWNVLVGSRYPFLRHEFLHALEHHGCLGERFGWLPRHLVLRAPDGRLLGAVPQYLKFNSYGEFVFDWSWADAYRRNGLAYYPKLVSASPYTPATGPKLLLADDTAADLRPRLVQAGLDLARQLELSSVHWLFTPDEETEALRGLNLMVRTGCQFHWTNRGYRDFDQLLAAFSSAKRKKIKRERRRVYEQGIRFRLLHGDQASEAEWALFHRLYESTFDKRGGIPTLTLPFFLDIAERMPEAVLLVLAYDGRQPVAAAFCLVGSDTLFGRHWGCVRDYHSLHFEACYYQGLDYCIERGLRRFEPGAQGEHKVSRGFLPTPTYSAHWIADPRFHTAIEHFLETETEGMADYLAEMNAHSPYRAAESD